MYTILIICEKYGQRTDLVNNINNLCHAVMLMLTYPIKKGTITNLYYSILKVK